MESHGRQFIQPRAGIMVGQLIPPVIVAWAVAVALIALGVGGLSAVPVLALVPYWVISPWGLIHRPARMLMADHGLVVTLRDGAESTYAWSDVQRVALFVRRRGRTPQVRLLIGPRRGAWSLLWRLNEPAFARFALDGRIDGFDDLVAILKTRLAPPVFVGGGVLRELGIEI